MQIDVCKKCKECARFTGTNFGCAGKSVGCYNDNEMPLCFEKKPKPKVKAEPKRISKDQYYLDIALAVSKRSTCIKRRYGCVIVANDTVVAMGYNGSPRGCVNCCDKGTCKRQDAEKGLDYDNCVAVHAEQNAITVASGIALKGATMYLACENLERFSFVAEKAKEILNPEPCVHCTRMIRNAGITRVVNRRGDVCLS